MIKKIMLGLLGSLALFGSWGAEASTSTATETDTPGLYQTSNGVIFQVNNPSHDTYTGIEPDEPASGYDLFTKKNCDVGVKVTYDLDSDKTTYLYDYVMYKSGTESKYWAFDLGANKITKNDEFDFYVVNQDIEKEYLVEMENKNPSYFSFYAKGLPSGSYQLKIVVKGDKTVTMNGVDIIEELSGENAVFGECGIEGESPCTVPTSKTVYDYFYYSFLDHESTASTAKEKLDEYVSLFGYDPYDYQMDANYYLMTDILGENSSNFNHAGHLYKHRMNCSYFLYTNQAGNYPTAYINGIFDQGLLHKYFYDSTLPAKEEGETWCSMGDSKYNYDYTTYLKNGHTSSIEYYTLSLKYSYKVYTPKNIEEITFKGYMDKVANQMAFNIDWAYDQGIDSKQELINNLNAQIESLNQQLTTKEQEKEVLQNEITEKNRHIASLETLVNEKQKEIDAKAVELERAKNQVSVLSSQIKEKEDQLTLLLNDTNAKTEEIASLRNSIDTLKDLNKTANQKVSALEQEKAELEKAKNSLAQQITSLEATITSKQEEITNLNNTLATLQESITSKEKEIDTLKRVISFKDDKITGLEQEKEENKFLSSNGYWKKVFNFKNIEDWNIYCWLTWIGLVLVVIAGVVVLIKKKK